MQTVIDVIEHVPVVRKPDVFQLVRIERAARERRTGRICPATDWCIVMARHKMPRRAIADDHNVIAIGPQHDCAIIGTGAGRQGHGDRITGAVGFLDDADPTGAIAGQR